MFVCLFCFVFHSGSVGRIFNTWVETVFFQHLKTGSFLIRRNVFSPSWPQTCICLTLSLWCVHYFKDFSLFYVPYLLRGKKRLSQHWNHIRRIGKTRSYLRQNGFQVNPLCCQRPQQRIIIILKEDGFLGWGLTGTHGTSANFPISNTWNLNSVGKLSQQ